MTPRLRSTRRNGSGVGSGPVVGLDLAGTERGRTGFCELGPGRRTVTRVLRTDAEIVDAVRVSRPSVVSIDAPLFLPAGRVSIDVPGPPHLRASDRVLQQLGIRFFPISLGPMRTLTRRGLALRSTLEAEGVRVIEGYPGAAQDLLGIPRKGEGVERLREALVGLGFTGDVERAGVTHDELDAVSAAYLGERYLAGDFVAVGDPAEGYMVLAPKAAVLARRAARPGRAPSRRSA
jgi:predicted nuclease with RNAse H fold